MNKPTKHDGFEPLQDRVLVEPFPTIKKTPGGIILPDDQHEVINGGVVKATGPGRDDGLKMILKVGDEVLYGHHSGFEVSIKGKVYRLIRESDAYAKVK